MHILPGSTEVEDNMLTAGVHTGPSEFDIQNLRYVRGDLATATPSDTGQSFLFRIYENSTGCLLKGGFKLND